MKKIIIGISILAITATACNNNSNISEKNEKKDDTTINNTSSTKSDKPDAKVDGCLVRRGCSNCQ